MLNTLLRKLRERRDLRVRDGLLRDARKARAEAFACVKSAENRNDDRDLGRALMVLKAATHAELAASRGLTV